MIEWMGSNESITILKWIRDRSFTKAELNAYLDSIGYSDPYASGSTVPTIDRIMSHIKRQRYARYVNQRWVSNPAIIDDGIAMHREYPIEDSHVTYQQQISMAAIMTRGPIDVKFVDDIITQIGEERREKMRRSASPA